MAKKDNERWSREEHILAFNLYCKIPFGTIHMRNPKIKELAKLLGRTDGAVSNKLANFSRLDPVQQARGIKGREHGAKGEEEVWNEFHENPEALAFESERLLAKFTGQTLEQLAEIDERDLPKEGLERERIVRTRLNQHFFRATILATYEYRCCITGLAIPELLVASHIVPWADDSQNRMNPRNGLCLNALHDRAFDRGLVSIAPDWTIRYAKSIKSSKHHANPAIDWLLQFEGKPINLPEKFAPDPDLIVQHFERFGFNESDSSIISP